MSLILNTPTFADTMLYIYLDLFRLKVNAALKIYLTQVELIQQPVYLPRKHEFHN